MNQTEIELKIKKVHPDAVIPQYAIEGDAGLDLTAISKVYDEYGNVVYGVGLAVEIPVGHVGLLFPRSSNSKQDLLLSNSVGVIDSNYRGEIFFKYKPSAVYTEDDFEDDETGRLSFDFEKIDFCEKDLHSNYEIGDRIGQLLVMPYPKVRIQEVTELSDSARGSGGFGSTGK